MRFPSDDIVADELWLRRVQTLSQPFFERSDPDLNHLTRLGHRVCAVVQGTTQFDSKLAVLSDALHQGVDEIAQGSVVLRLIQINVLSYHKSIFMVVSSPAHVSTTKNSATEVVTDLLQ
jgi:hypothetical protein